MIGEIIKINGVELLVLNELSDGLFVIALNTGVKIKFSDSSNAYETSILREKAEKWLEGTGIKAIERNINLTPFLGFKSNILRVKVAPLMMHEYQIYYEKIYPHINDWFWLGTPYCSNDPNYVCFVASTGIASPYNYWSGSGLAPAFILDKDWYEAQKICQN